MTDLYEEVTMHEIREELSALVTVVQISSIVVQVEVQERNQWGLWSMYWS